MQRIEEINQAMQELHLSFEPFGKDTLMVRSVPSWMKDLAQEQFLNDLLDAFLQEKDLHFAKTQKKQIALLASKNSVHVHQKLTMEEMKNILIQLAECQNPWNDPSGRPIVMIVEESQLLKGLGR